LLIREAIAAHTLTDDTLVHLGGALTELGLCGSLTSDRGLGFADDGGAAHLRQLDFSYCARLRDSGIIRLVRECPRLCNLNLSHCRLTDAAFEGVVRCCPLLRVLDGSWNGSGVGERTVRALAACDSKLESFAVCGCRVRDNSLLALACACPRLDRFDTRGCELLTEAGIVAALCALPRVRSLELCQISRISEQSVDLLSCECIACIACTWPLPHIPCPLPHITVAATAHTCVVACAASPSALAPRHAA
jgi:hypothetical protein